MYVRLCCMCSSIAMYIIKIALVLMPALVLGDTYYVKPDCLPAPACPNEPCLTLEQYAAKQDKYFTSGSVFQFIAGNHTTQKVIFFRSLSDIVLKGTGKNNIVEMKIHLEDVSRFILQGFTIISQYKEYSPDHSNMQFQGLSNSSMYLNHSNITIENCTFANHSEGALYISNGSNTTIRGSSFVGNRAVMRGGAITVNQSEILIIETRFINNSAVEAGGVYSEQSHCIIVSSLFLNNRATAVTGHGGAVVFVLTNTTCYNTTIKANLGTAIFISRSNATFMGNTQMIANIQRFGKGTGGAITAKASTVTFTGNTLFERNYASVQGGAIAGLVRTVFTFTGTTIFKNNVATTEGGGAILGTVHTSLLLRGFVLFKNNSCTTCYGGAISFTGNSRIVIANNVTFEFNWAEMGGAIYMRDSFLTLKQHSKLITSQNHAKFFGGALFHLDNINYYQCNFSNTVEHTQDYILIILPDCFMELENFKFSQHNKQLYEIHSYNDSAGLDGQFMFGGLMDKCHIIDTQGSKVQYDLLYNVIFHYHILHIHPDKSGLSKNNLISSEAFTLCFCTDDDKNYQCSEAIDKSVVRGQKFEVSVIALSQGNNTYSAPPLLAEVSKTARLKLNQQSQNLTAGCTTLFYNMYSTEEQEQLKLYPDKTCRDTGLAVAFVNVTFLPCPDAFTKSMVGDSCICEERLQKYNARCTVGDNDSENLITRRADSNFWMGYSNESYGLILYKSCPTDYCKTGEVNISLSQLDIQCDFHHSGMLCGACATNYSLMFGNSKCERCSDKYLLLLIAFAAAGILLIAFLSLFRLTVATGMINSVILYANIVQANKNLFFPKSTINVLTVFIAWMNLDLGFPTCFYEGMDAYAHTWLQFAFPIYVWVLISVIILTSRYSTVMTRLLGSNPVAVLATLLLMSYTKILKTLVAVYSSVQLEYPTPETRTVWLKDANVPYLQSKHLVFAVVSTVFTAAFFLPYTVFLLLGYKLYYFRTKFLHRLMPRMKPLLDSYYAPYKKHTRYWTGLLLLVRCALYIVFSFDSIGGTDYSLLAIITALTVLIVIAWLSLNIYKSFYINVIEASVFLNLVILSATTSKVNSPVLAHSLVGIVFATMVGIILYHFHFTYISKTAWWLKVTLTLASLVETRRKIRGAANAERTKLVQGTERRLVTTSVVTLRESLMEDPTN